MNHWLVNSKRNLLSLSKATEFTEALREWRFTGEVDDYEDEDADIHCELCEHTDLVHHFHIRNSLTSRSLLVGSSCILKFQEIEILDKHGKAITDPQQRKLSLDDALRAQIIQTSLIPLRILWKLSRDDRNSIEFLAGEIKNDQGLEPDQLSYLLKSFERKQIPYAARLYKISLRSNDTKLQVSLMPEHDFQRITPAFTKPQIERANALRHEA